MEERNLLLVFHKYQYNHNDQIYGEEMKVTRSSQSGMRNSQSKNSEGKISLGSRRRR